MNTTSRSLLAAVAFTVSIAGCHRPGPSAVTQEWRGDPTVPDAAETFARHDAEEKAKAKAMEETAALQAPSGAVADMSKSQESKAMPLPGQANDHSNVALDKKKGS